MPYAFLQSAFSNTNASSYTFAAQNLGAAAADRHIIVAAVGGLSAHTVSSITVGGVTATNVASVASTANTIRSTLQIAAVPTGTTGDVVVTLNTTIHDYAIGLYRATGLASAATDDSGTSGTGDPVSVSGIDVQRNGFAIGAGGSSNILSTTWTELTEDFDQTLDVNQAFGSSASKSYPSGGSITATMDAFTSGQGCLAVACWHFVLARPPFRRPPRFISPRF